MIMEVVFLKRKHLPLRSENARVRRLQQQSLEREARQKKGNRYTQG